MSLAGSVPKDTHMRHGMRGSEVLTAFIMCFCFIAGCILLVQSGSLQEAWPTA